MVDKQLVISNFLLILNYKAKVKSYQELPLKKFISKSKIKGRSSSLETNVSPNFQITWPSPYRLPEHVNTRVPSFIENRVGVYVTNTLSPSSLTINIQPTLHGKWTAKECSSGCPLDKVIKQIMQCDVISD